MLSLLSLCINENVSVLCMYIYLLPQTTDPGYSTTEGHLQNVRDCITHVTLGTEIKD